VNPMRTTVTIIGAGQAGLAMSRCLTDRSIDHVILERGTVANAWRTERWDSLQLLTPNWLTRLPSFRYDGTDPDGYMNAAQVASFLDGYRASFDAPVLTEQHVLSVTGADGNFVTTTTSDRFESRAVVVATGACSTPKIPELAGKLPGSVQQLAPIHYRNPDQIESNSVLVVGASASGAQLADELARSGRTVTLAVGEHTRLPRTYRGMDIHWWLDTLGVLDERIDELEDVVRARRLPSLQLVGSPEKRTLGLNELTDSGVQLVGRLAGVANDTVQFSGSLANMAAMADLKMYRLLDRIDERVAQMGLADEVGPADRPAETAVPTPVVGRPTSDFGAVVWATGFRPNYPWLDDALLDRKGAIVHDGGVMAEPGMYVLGLPFTRRRKSSFLDGVGPDAQELSAHLATHLDETAVPIA
ncbi:MAG: NAD(P)-binding domain-containing protein, partial [Acidimicrobiales bacterium]